MGGNDVTNPAVAQQVNNAFVSVLHHSIFFSFFLSFFVCVDPHFLFFGDVRAGGYLLSGDRHVRLRGVRPLQRRWPSVGGFRVVGRGGTSVLRAPLRGADDES